MEICPKCGAVMVLRVRAKDRKEFYGCSNYPVCKVTAPLPAYAEMRKLNAPTLPGFDDTGT
jgi:ssDNA-binding Zn-finger/Zn-ribbon topoisomerase 1